MTGPAHNVAAWLASRRVEVLRASPLLTTVLGVGAAVGGDPTAAAAAVPVLLAQWWIIRGRPPLRIRLHIRKRPPIVIPQPRAH